MSSLTASRRAESAVPVPASTHRARVPEQRLPCGIPPEKGVAAFERALRAFSAEAEIFISPQVFDRPGRQDQQADLSRPRESGVASAPQAVGPSTGAQASVAGSQDDVEQQIVDIWRAILGVESLGVRDNFFETGADSLSALRALARIKRDLRVGLSVPNLYEYPTVAQLAGLIRERQARG